MHKILWFGFMTGVSLYFSSGASAATYELDTAHCRFDFSVKHMVISNVGGNFKIFQGKGVGTFEGAKNSIESLEVKIDPASIDTNEPKRDAHLRSPDFFDVVKFPTMEFKSSSITYTSGGAPQKIHGTLLMHGVTKPLVLDVEWGGILKDPKGKDRLAFEASGTLNRKDFGLVYNKVLDNGGLAVGDEVKIHVQVEALKVEASKDLKKAK